MPLHPQAQQLLDTLKQAGMAEIGTQTPAELRAQMAVMPRPAGEEVAEVSDRGVPGPAGEIPVRVYRGQKASDGLGIVYYHGGGWVFGDLESHDATCRALANAARATVVAVDYRLAPEHPFPAAADDAFAATAWVAEHGSELGIDPARIAVAGDSAGGNLAAVVTLRARAAGGPAIGFQALVYPVTDCRLDTGSYAANGEGYLLTRAGMEWFWGHYVATPADRVHPDASPLLAEDLRGLPPALVITAEFDPLRDEGEAYAARLKEAGVATEMRRYEGMIHGFFGNVALDDGGDAVRVVAAATRAAFGLR